MFRASFSQRVLVVGLLTALLAGGEALAQREGRGRGGGDGGGRSSSGREGGGGGGSSRSFSGGGGGSSRSFSRGGESSSRSFSGGSPRSFSGDSGRSSRSFSSDSGASRQFSRPSESSSSRSFSAQPRVQTSQGARSSRSFEQGSAPQRSFRSSQPEGDRSTFSPSTRGSFRTDQSVDRSGEARSFTRERSSDRQPGTIDQGGRRYQAARPSEDRVRDFLQLPGDDSQRQAGKAGERGEPRDGRSFRGDSDDARRAEIARRFGDSDRAGRDGDSLRNPAGRDFDRTRDFSRDRDQDFANRGDREGDRGDRDYQRWREGAWSRDRDRDGDNRDWSGKWREGDRFASARHIRDDWRHKDRDRFPFHSNWWGGHSRWHGDRWNWWGDYAFRYNRPFYWWAWTTAPRLSTWVSFGWPRPYYWDYGYGEYIYYDNGAVYVNGRWYQPAPVFYDRTVQIVERAPELTPDEAAELDWLPLGVFAVTPDGAAQADVLVQLAVTKDGVIGGTASDERTGTAFPIEGMVDKQTQRAVWSYTNERNQRIIMETSIYNLTQPEATGLVHYGPNDLRVIQLVRLEQPDSGAAVGTTAAPAIGELPAP